MNRTDTVLIPPPWLKPPAATLYLTPHARLRRAVRRFLDSEFAQDVKSNLPRIPLVIGGVTVAYVAALVVQAVAMAAS